MRDAWANEYPGDTVPQLADMPATHCRRFFRRLGHSPFLITVISMPHSGVSADNWSPFICRALAKKLLAARPTYSFIAVLSPAE